jgi:hypothetical protein
MSIDLKRSWYQWTDPMALATGATVDNEGQGMVSVLEGGVEKVKPSAGGAGEKIVGFARFRQKDVTSRALVESWVVPTSAPYVVSLGQQALISGQIRVQDLTGGVDLTVVGVAPAAGEVQVNYLQGTLTFNAAQAGDSLNVYYRYQLTLAQSLQFFHQAPTNYPDANYFLQVGCGKGKGRLFTMFYDASKAYDNTAALTLGADGIITVGGAGPVIAGARVVNQPSANDPYLGIEFMV